MMIADGCRAVERVAGVESELAISGQMPPRHARVACGRAE